MFTISLRITTAQHVAVLGDKFLKYHFQLFFKLKTLNLRFLWLMFLTLATTAFAGMIMSRIKYYLEFHHVTGIEEADGVVPLFFPTVTFCNVNSMVLNQKIKKSYKSLKNCTMLE